jgi:hypothetical protein
MFMSEIIDTCLLMSTIVCFVDQIFLMAVKSEMDRRKKTAEAVSGYCGK